MRLILSVISFALIVLNVNAAPAISDDIIIIDGKVFSAKIDINTFMPIYGGYQIKKLINSKTWGYLQSFLKNNQALYTNFKAELASEGVFLPEYADFNMNILLPSDYALALIVVGETNIEQALKTEFVEYLINHIQQNKYIEDRIKDLVGLSGITFNDKLDIDAVLRTIGKTFEPFILNFVPYALQMIIFGK